MDLSAASGDLATVCSGPAAPPPSSANERRSTRLGRPEVNSFCTQRWRLWKNAPLLVPSGRTIIGTAAGSDGLSAVRVPATAFFPQPSFIDVNRYTPQPLSS